MSIHQLNFRFVLAICVLGFLIHGNSHAQDYIQVTSATPSSALQGTFDLNVEITGKNFAKGAVVRFLRPGSDVDMGDIIVNKVRVKGSGKLTVNIDVTSDSDTIYYDIEVQLSGSRKGKGTTLFSVQSKSNDDNGALGNECAIEFEAAFVDREGEEGEEGDGVSSDGGGNYVAGTGSGPGFRLDTNGSIKLERNNDTRFITIDFNVAGVCDEYGDFPTAAFCTEKKGVDLRFDRDIEPLNLCELDYNQTGFVSLKFTFEAEPGNTLRNTFRGRDNKDPTTLHLRYGCWPDAQPDDLDRYHPAEVTRLDEFTWYIEGEMACLHTNLGNSYLVLVPDSSDELELGLLTMPFGLTITDINKPEDP